MSTCVPGLPASSAGRGQRPVGVPGPRLAPGSEAEGLLAPPSPPLSVCPHLTERLLALSVAPACVRLCASRGGGRQSSSLPSLPSGPECPPLLSLGRGQASARCAVRPGRQCPLAELPCRGRVASLNLSPRCPLGFTCVKVLLLCTGSHRARGAAGEQSQLAANGSAWQGSALLFPCGCGLHAGSLRAPLAVAMAWISPEAVGSLHSR